MNTPHTVSNKPLSPEQLKQIEGGWRTANYLPISHGQGEGLICTEIESRYPNEYAVWEREPYNFRRGSRRR